MTHKIILTIKFMPLSLQQNIPAQVLSILADLMIYQEQAVVNQFYIVKLLLL